jgi:hypothetical protein
MLRLLTSAKSMVFLIVVLCVPLILIRSVLFTYRPLLDQAIGGKHGHKAQQYHVSQCLLVVSSTCTCLVPSPEARHPQVFFSLDDFNPRCFVVHAQARRRGSCFPTSSTLCQRLVRAWCCCSPRRPPAIAGPGTAVCMQANTICVQCKTHLMQLAIDCSGLWVLACLSGFPCLTVLAVYLRACTNVTASPLELEVELECAITAPHVCCTPQVTGSWGREARAQRLHRLLQDPLHTFWQQRRGIRLR